LHDQTECKQSDTKHSVYLTNRKRTKNHKGFTCIGQFLTIAPGGRELYRALLWLRMIFGKEYYVNSASGTSSAQPTFRFKLEFILSHTL
jgi:hypothetical protein